MMNEGTLSKTYAFDEHVGRFNVLEFYKDDCHSKPFKAVQDYYAYHAAQGRHKSTFEYKPVRRRTTKTWLRIVSRRAHHVDSNTR